jgi:hypothetical protein
MMWADFLSTTEPNLAILCISLPILRPLLGKIRGISGYLGRSHGDFNDPNRPRTGGQWDFSKDSFVQMEDLATTNYRESDSEIILTQYNSAHDTDNARKRAHRI